MCTFLKIKQTKKLKGNMPNVSNHLFYVSEIMSGFYSFFISKVSTLNIYHYYIQDGGGGQTA